MNNQNIGQFYPTRNGHMAKLIWIEDAKPDGTHLFIHYETVNGKLDYIGEAWHYGDGRVAVSSINSDWRNFDLI